MVHSGPTASPGAAGNWNAIKGGNDRIIVAYVQAQTGTTDFTKSTAKSGAQAVFMTEIGTADFVFDNTISMFKQLPNPVTGQSQTTQNFRLGMLMQETSITNSSNIYWEMTCYDYVARRDTSKQQPSIDACSPLHMWTWGLTYSALATGPTTSYLYPWTVKATPFQSQMFTQFYKIVKSTTVWVGPGATHTHVMKNNLNKLYYPSRFPVSSGNIQGVTCGTIWTIIGQPVEATGANAPTNKVTTGIIDGTVVTKIKATASQKYANKRVYNAQSGTSFYQATQSDGAFKALLDNSYEYKATLEGG